MLSIHETIITEIVHLFKPGPGENESEIYRSASQVSKRLNAIPSSAQKFQDLLVGISFSMVHVLC